jgi:hypothetical protein
MFVRWWFMGSFNVKILRYKENNEEEIRIYKQSICTDYKVPDREFRPKGQGDRERSAREGSRRSKQKVYGYARANKWDWFVTLTFNPDLVDSFDYDDVTNKLASWLNNVKKRKCPNMSYMGVPELHQTGRYHFHFLMSEINEMDFVDSGRKDNKGRPIYNLGNYSLGFTTATQVSDSAKSANYLSKYITKELTERTLNKRRYWNSKNLVMPTEVTMMLDEEQLEDLRLSVKEKTTSGKVVVVDTPQYSNEIEYLQVKNK